MLAMNLLAGIAVTRVVPVVAITITMITITITKGMTEMNDSVYIAIIQKNDEFKHVIDSRNFDSLDDAENWLRERMSVNRTDYIYSVNKVLCGENGTTSFPVMSFAELV
jgi:hypothetical protein